MNEGYKIVLKRLRNADDLRPRKLVLSVTQQLQEQSRRQSSPYRYAVKIQILEGQMKPASDLDNYAKPIIDAITQSQLVWDDDNQIDTLVIRRQRDGDRAESQATLTTGPIAGQHRGVPSYFRGWCADARCGEMTYEDLGCCLASGLEGEVPYDVDENAWRNEIARLAGHLKAGEKENAWMWFYEHLPKFLKCIPRRRKGAFVAGAVRAHNDGKLDG